MDWAKEGSLFCRMAMAISSHNHPHLAILMDGKNNKNKNYKNEKKNRPGRCAMDVGGEESVEGIGIGKSSPASTTPNNAPMPNCPIVCCLPAQMDGDDPIPFPMPMPSNAGRALRVCSSCRLFASGTCPGGRPTMPPWCAGAGQRWWWTF
jgi:hypothetical protein